MLKRYAITQNVTQRYRYNELTTGVNDFLPCLKVLEINIFESLVLSVHVTGIKSIFG